MSDPFVVTKSPFKYTRLVDDQENFHNSANVFDARKKAEEIGLQLVCFAMPQGSELALCKIIDYGKWKYINEKSQHKIKMEQKTGVKEVKISARTDEGDLRHKLRHISEFLVDGMDVIVTMTIEGRDLEHMDLANLKMDDILKRLGDCSKIVSRKVVDGRKKQIVVRLVKK